MRFLPWTILIMIASLLLASCEEERHYYVANIGNDGDVPTMSTTDVNTFISDSGYTKYYIRTDLWDMYDECNDPYWKFPTGVELEQYDNKHNIESTLRCDSARYFTQKRIWKLDGNVVMVNVERDSFLTNQVFWDQTRRKIFSDSFVHIVKSDRIIEGYGFDSNEQMTMYTVKRPTGIFPVNQKNDAQASAEEAAADAEASQEGVSLRPAPRPASQRTGFQVFQTTP